MFSSPTSKGREGNDMNAKRRNPEIILKDGKPRAVILDIEEYQGMLERLEDAEDLRMLEEMRKKPLKFTRLEDFLDEYTPSV
jgi:PHD/YefM family antitoxin component YafN of YafNO toxin-antitoxin module